MADVSDNNLSGVAYSNGSQFTILPSKTTYHVLGENIEVEGYKDASTALFVSIVNILGKKYYDEVKKQGINFPMEIENFLKDKFLIIQRDEKIESIINDKRSE